ncbi:MAG: DUF4112 domain-containing protein [Verrucomicrobia bacterium]|nr:DUF4112 domain-containing protein [Verrucomicrobiota bacterium]
MKSEIGNRKSEVYEWEVLPPEEKQRRAAVEPLFRWVATIMDNLLRIPGMKRRVGLNPVVDFIPVVGDVSAAFVSATALLYATRRGLPKILVARMALNILVNELVGAIPLVGSAFAFWFRPNQRNYNLLQQHVHQPSRPSKGDWVFVLSVIGVIVLVICGGLIASLWILHQLFRLLGAH